MDLVIRSAQRDDLPAIAAIYNEAVVEEATADLDPVSVESRGPWLEDHRPDRYPVLVGEVSGEVVGWASLSPYRPGRGAVRATAEISYYVARSHRGNRIASRLVEACVDRCPALELRTLFAIVLADNVASIGLLERLGFAQWGFLPAVARFGDREVGHVYMGRHVG